MASRVFWFECRDVESDPLGVEIRTVDAVIDSVDDYVVHTEDHVEVPFDAALYESPQEALDLGCQPSLRYDLNNADDVELVYGAGFEYHDDDDQELVRLARIKAADACVAQWRHDAEEYQRGLLDKNVEVTRVVLSINRDCENGKKND